MHTVTELHLDSVILFHPEFSENILNGLNIKFWPEKLKWFHDLTDFKIAIHTRILFF